MDSWDLDEFQPVKVGDTQPTKPVTSRDLAGDPPEVTQPIRPVARQRRRRRRIWRGVRKPLVTVLVLLAVYFFVPWQHQILVLGIDRVPEGTTQGRSDTMILTGIEPLSGRVNMLSIPRDLWVPIPGYGENRINTAHYFAEAAEKGSGPQAAMDVVESNFNVRVGYYARVRLEGFPAVIDALGGIDVTIEERVLEWGPGTHYLDGTQALAFVRDRTGDDFYRMAHGQVFVTALVKKLINPLTWIRIPGALVATAEAIDTNVPVWLWPRLGLAVVRALPGGFDTRTLDRTMVNSWVTADGAQVLLPNWEAILPLVDELF